MYFPDLLKKKYFNNIDTCTLMKIYIPDPQEMK